MRRGLTTALALALLTASLSAWSYLAFEQITVANTAIGFTSGKITPTGLTMPTTASCRLETAEVRWTIDGTVPTTTVGTLLEIGDILTVTGHDALITFKAIRTGGTSGVLDCTYSAP